MSGSGQFSITKFLNTLRISFFHMQFMFFLILMKQQRKMFKKLSRRLLILQGQKNLAWTLLLYLQG
ncbi:hypothetical protein B5F27_15955 [Faecalibacterium sp. An192]|nr:hypothetical protein B5F27_15955 [Faecalibacterium sp. An192]